MRLKKALLIATDLTSICCVYKEKIVKTKKNVVSIQIQKDATFNSIVNKSIKFQTNYSDITNNSHRLFYDAFVNS